MSQAHPTYIKIDSHEQSLCLFEASHCIAEYLISTGKNGMGELNGSGKTPRGEHRICAKIGDNAPVNSVFIGRRQTGEIWTPALHAQYPGRDWILTRILWLSGCEIGKNRLHEFDTKRRYIYIHGTPAVTELGKPGSKGCIRMANADVVDLFNRVDRETKLYIC